MANIFGRQVVLPLTNKSGGGVIAGDVVIVDTANDTAFTTTTSAGFTGGVGVAQETIANNATGRVLVEGYAALVNVAASVTRGHFGTTHTVAKQATSAGASRTVGTFCQFLTGGTTPTARIYPPDLNASTGNIATDPIWDAAGDLAVGSGADTAARLAIGAVGGHVSRINGAVAWDSGTSNPGAAAAGDRYYRSDLGLAIYYDGTRWVTLDLFTSTQGLLTITAVNNETERHFAAVKSLDVWVVAWNCVMGVFGTNNGSNFWTIRLDKRATNDTLTSVSTIDTSAMAGSTWTPFSTAIGAAVTTSTHPSLLISASVKTGTPANCLFVGGFTYRLIVT